MRHEGERIRKISGLIGVGADEIIPPHAGVTLVDYRDRLQLRPYYWCREFTGVGRIDSKKLLPQGSGRHGFLSAITEGKDVWVIVTWRRYEDGREEALRMHVLDPYATEADAREAFEDEMRFRSMTKKELTALQRCFKPSEDDLLYLESFPDDDENAGASIEERDLYQARLEVMAGLQPRTVELLYRAEAIESEDDRERISAEAVSAFFAELAHHWTDDQLKRWQHSNPLGTEWLSYFLRVKGKPQKELDPVNHELALNWLLKKYNLLTAEELASAVNAVTGQQIKPATIKKRRERLGLTTKRSPGPRPNSEG